jgi:hypothetical protein
VVVAGMPFPTDQLDVTPLFEEPRVLVVPLDPKGTSSAFRL